MSIITFNSPRPVLADRISRTATANIVLVVAAAAFVGLLAQISIPLGFTPVPLTGQTFGIMLAGAALGWRRAAMAMSLYVIAGLAGLPWFAGGASGYVGANFGYLIGFVVSAGVLGWLAANGNDRKILGSLISMAIADGLIFVCGVSWLAHDLHVSLAMALHYGFYPFVWGEVIKAGIAGFALPGSWRLVDRATKH
jgi:biotin transport system substrate-specific component